MSTVQVQMAPGSTPVVVRQNQANPGVVVVETDKPVIVVQKPLMDAPRPTLAAFGGAMGWSVVIIVLGQLLMYWAPYIGFFFLPAFGLEFYSAITLIFVMMGFSFVVIYDQNIDIHTAVPLSQTADITRFLTRRAAKVLPTYFLALLVSIAPLVIYRTRTQITQSVPLTLLLVQSLTGTIGNDWSMPLWLISALFICYLVFPILLRTLRKLSTRILVLFMVVLAIISAVMSILWVSLGNFDNLVWLHTFAPFRLIHFMIGMCAGFLANKKEGLGGVGAFSRPHPIIVSDLISVLFLLNQALCAILVNWQTTNPSMRIWLNYLYITEYISPMFQAMWLLALSHPQCESMTKIVLASGLSKFLGLVAYPVYCLAFPITHWAAWAVNRGISNETVALQNYSGIINGWWCFPSWAIAVLFVVIYLLGSIIHYAVERPLRAMIARDKDDTDTWLW